MRKKSPCKVLVIDVIIEILFINGEFTFSFKPHTSFFFILVIYLFIFLTNKLAKGESNIYHASKKEERGLVEL